MYCTNGPSATGLTGGFLTGGNMSDVPHDAETEFWKWKWNLHGLVEALIGERSYYHGEERLRNEDYNTLDQHQQRWFQAGMSLEEASERTVVMMARIGMLKPPWKYLLFPPHPEHPNGELQECIAPQNIAQYYRVLRDTHIVALYHAAYYRSTQEVVDDIIERRDSARSEGDPFYWENDLVVWRDNRILAVFQEAMPGDDRHVYVFDEDRNDPGPTFRPNGWTPYDLWVATGKGPVTFDRDQLRKDNEDGLQRAD